VKGTKNTRADALSRIGINQIVDKSMEEKWIESQSKDSYVQQNKNKPHFSTDNGLVYKKAGDRMRLVVPEELKTEVMTMCHNDLGGGHLGFSKTWPKLAERFCWPGMYSDLLKWLRACEGCAKKKDPEATRTPLQPIPAAEYPFEMLGVDILGPLPETKKGNEYVLVFTCYLSKWVEAFPMKKIDAKTVAKLLIDEIICRHSAPKVLLSDQGAQFMSSLIKEVCEYFKTKKINTTAYRPQCNGLTERFNATLCQILSMYVSENQDDWDDFLPTTLFAYRVSCQETTKMAPFELLYGRKPCLPNDVERLAHKSNPVVSEFNKNWKRAIEKINKAGLKNKNLYDNDLKPRPIIEIGDDVRLEIKTTKIGLKAKLRGEVWGGPYKVFGKAPNGNLKLWVKGKTYVTHPDRVKRAEISFETWPPDVKRIFPPKSVTFNTVINQRSD
jgi:hypothetical protein